VSWWLRRGAEAPPTAAIVLSALAVGLALITGWLGGELVDRLGVGVDDGAHLDAPNSDERASGGRPRAARGVDGR
jgi:uncharacterized membrane protein